MTYTSSRQNLKDHIALTVLEDVDSLLMAEAFQTDRVHGEDLVSPLEASLFGSSSLLKHGLHEDWHVPVWGTKPSHDRETEAMLSPENSTT